MVKLANTSNQTVKPQVFIQPGDILDVPVRIAEDLKRSTPELTRGQPAVDLTGLLKADLLELAQERDIEGRSDMTKAELIEALEA